MRWIKKIDEVIYQLIDQMVYLHIPKTGGTYVHKAIKPIIYLSHSFITKSITKLIYLYFFNGFSPHYFVRCKFFVTVRNIYSWLVSYYEHTNDKEHYDYKIYQKGFDYFVKSIAERTDLWPNRKFIFFQMFAEENQLIADWILHQEFLDKELSIFAEKMGLVYQKQNRERVGNHGDYRSYYSDNLIDLIRTTWGRELKLLGYDFEGFNRDKAMLSGEINENIKKLFRYSHKRDELMYNYKIISGEKYGS